MTLKEAQKKFEEAAKKFGKAYPKNKERFERYRDVRLNALEAMVQITEHDQIEYKRLLAVFIEDHLRWKKLGKG